jgi:hypothetical protein
MILNKKLVINIICLLRVMILLEILSKKNKFFYIFIGEIGILGLRFKAAAPWKVNYKYKFSPWVL